ncbi:MAG: IreB family regulatory phosphoprotein [Tissierellia bacterium]|nr:IreB family regulatory phosphoprotein [Tissierellia bacterium]
MNDKFNETMRFDPLKEAPKTVTEIIRSVYTALEKKGYDPKNQIIGYILSGDPTYITSHDNARNMIRQIDRDELLEELLTTYLEVKVDKEV